MAEIKYVLKLEKGSKGLFQFTSWKSKVNLPIPFEEIEKIRVRWMSYETGSTGGRFIKVRFPHMETNGVHYLGDGSTTDYFFATAIDARANVSHYYENFSGEHDIVLGKPIPKLWSFDIEFTINDAPAFDITVSNPITMEIGFY